MYSCRDTLSKVLSVQVSLVNKIKNKEDFQIGNPLFVSESISNFQREFRSSSVDERK